MQNTHLGGDGWFFVCACCSIANRDEVEEAIGIDACSISFFLQRGKWGSATCHMCSRGERVEWVRLREQYYRLDLDQRSDNPMPLRLVRLAGTKMRARRPFALGAASGCEVPMRNELAIKASSGLDTIRRISSRPQHAFGQCHKDEEFRNSKSHTPHVPCGVFCATSHKWGKLFVRLGGECGNHFLV